jgi:predicted dehydrogenase
VRVAFIGASHWHLPLYLDPLLEIPGVSVVGVSDPNEARIRALADRLGCVGDRDFRELCRSVRPDFVFALGRHVDMPDQARFLIAERIPFAIEKPCGLSEADVASIAEQASRAGAFAAVPLVFRNGEFATLLREEASRGGAQYATFRFIAGFPARYLEAGCDWMLDPALSGGGCTINLGVHFLDLCLALMGPEVEVSQAEMSNAGWSYPIEDYSAVTLKRGGQICIIETGYIYPGPTSTFDMHFAMRTPFRYMIAHDPETVELIDTSGDRNRRAMPTTNVPQYKTFVEDVLERVRRDAPPLAALSDMVPVMRLVDAAYAKARASAQAP